MGVTAEDYRDQLLALQPDGPALPRDPNSNWAKLLLAFADSLSRVGLRGEQLIIESDPRSTYELLEEWERAFGLPGPCVPLGQSVDERRNALVAQVTARGGQTPAYYISVAAALGYVVTIDENVEGPHVWRINGPETTITEFTCDSPCDQPLRKWGNELLECVMNRIKPAHTRLLFGYSANPEPEDILGATRLGLAGIPTADM